ncbi:radical SAM protein [Methylocystis sp.]|uniref:radical SAM protein n=1 Tax=Methylocystis sp. TaxID=1911079 RepID=UPI003DA4ECBE
MERSIYLISPKCPEPSAFGMDVFTFLGFKSAKYQADLSIVTVATVIGDGVTIEICDEDLSEINFDHSAPVVGISCRIYQEDRVIAIADDFRRRGKFIIVGGPAVPLMKDLLKPHCDVLVTGEIEDIASTLFTDVFCGKAKHEYYGNQPDLASSRPPRWDLYSHHRVLLGALQTSRGCPFECEFCDVPVILGRKQRFKTIPQVIQELDALYNYGYRVVSILDDNFLVYRRRSHEVLTAIRDWNHSRRSGGVALAAMFSLDLARDPELLALAAEAGVRYAFIGIESINVDSLRETKKKQNIVPDILKTVSTLPKLGIMPAAGIVVGFDADDKGVFEKQFDFAMRSPIPILGISMLTPIQTAPLYERMMKEGRIGPSFSGVPSLVPKQMTRECLEKGYMWLLQNLYTPANFAQRMCAFIREFIPNQNAPPPATPEQMRPIELEATSRIIERLTALGDEESRAMHRIRAALDLNPGAELATRMALFEYARVYTAVNLLPGQYARSLAGVEQSGARAVGDSPAFAGTSDG